MPTPSDSLNQMTEPEAKMRVCHVTRSQQEFTRFDRQCLASLCMAWRWVSRSNGTKYGLCGYVHLGGQDETT